MQNLWTGQLDLQRKQVEFDNIMVTNLERYQKIVDSLVKKSFPVLKGKKIIIKQFKSDRYFGSALNIFSIRIISINKNIGPKKSAVGIFAHELAHLEEYERTNVISRLFGSIKYWIISKKFRERDENYIDKSVIKKGYAKELFINRQWVFAHRKDKNLNKYYLSPEEIKKYAKSIRKW